MHIKTALGDFLDQWQIVVQILSTMPYEDMEKIVDGVNCPLDLKELLKVESTNYS